MSNTPIIANNPVPSGVLLLTGDWIARDIAAIDIQIKAIDALLVKGQNEIELDGSQLKKMDSAGVWILQHAIVKIRQQRKSVRLINWPAQYQRLMDEVEKIDSNKVDATVVSANANIKTGFLYDLGKRSANAVNRLGIVLSFIGEVALSFLQVLWQPDRWRLRMVSKQIQIAGLNALPIIGVTSFLLGIVIAYQGADQLKHYGANIFVVELLGYSMLREFSPLITAIIVAGRSGSAYAAQIGSMVVNEEVDAMRTIGIVPIELLVLPKIIALVVALPLLTVFSDVTGVIGGMVMARSQLDVDPMEFLLRFGHEVHLPSFLVGVGKALVFAIVIATVGCFQGFQTKANADSVGQQTTRSVVQSIFIIIIFDALFSIVLNLIDL